VRGAIRILQEVGFLDRALVSGSKYQPTEEGLRRKPILFVFGSDYALAFIEANRRARAVRERRSGQRRTITPSNPQRLSTTFPVDRLTNSPKNKSEAVPKVIMGQLSKGYSLPPSASESNPKLEAALERFLQGAIGKAGRGSQTD
jgi:hypothetical protein